MSKQPEASDGFPLSPAGVMSLMSKKVLEIS